MSKELNRVTITLSDKHFNYIEKVMSDTNMTRTSLVQLAIDTWIQQREGLDVLGRLVEEAERQREEAKIES